MICPNCQAPNREGAAFCMSCGAKLSAAPPKAAAAPQPPAFTPPAYTPPPAPAYEAPTVPPKEKAPPAVQPAASYQPLVGAPAGLQVGGILEGDTIIITDVRMKFSSMVVFMVKWTLAAIPALIVLWLIFAVIFSIVGGLFVGLFF